MRNAKHADPAFVRRFKTVFDRRMAEAFPGNLVNYRDPRTRIKANLVASQALHELGVDDTTMRIKVEWQAGRVRLIVEMPKKAQDRATGKA